MLSLFFNVTTASHAAGVTVLPTNVTTPSAGCSFIGIEGKYITQIQEALDLINKIRKEACDEGVTNPSTGNPLTSGDYVPIQWSADLEYIARIRAAEASLTMNHARTNGESIWFSGPNGISSNAEVIAWNWSETMTKGIEQWYEEKNDWVNKKPGAVTGHYTSMIKPGNRYVGLGTFCSNTAQYYNTTAGEFSSSCKDSTRGTSTGNIIQTLEVKNNNISYEINCPDKLSNTDKISVTATVSFTDYWGGSITTKGLVFTDNTADNIKWSSSNSNIVVSNGEITVKSCGESVITAELPNGKKITKSVSAEHSYKSAVTKSATCTENGVKTFTCQNCGNSYTEQIKAAGHKYSSQWTTDQAATCTQEGSKSHHCTVCGEKGSITVIPKTQHTFGAYVVKQPPTATSEGIEERTCSSCGTKETRAIAKLSASSSTSSSSNSVGSSSSKQSSSSSVGSSSTNMSSSSSPVGNSSSASSADSSSVTGSSAVENSSSSSASDNSSSNSANDSSSNSSASSSSISEPTASSGQNVSSGSDGSGGSDSNLPLIVGVSVSGVVLVGGVTTIILWAKKKKK